MMKNKIIRIGNIGFRPIKDSQLYIGEIVKYENNPYFGKENEYKWLINANGEKMAYKELLTSTFVSESCFKNKESCYVLSFITKGEDPNILNVSTRVITLQKSDLKDYIQVCKFLYNI